MNTLAGKIRIDFRSVEPIYLQIARQIEQCVANGDLKLGDQLPTVRELATELRINFNTVTRAYKVLDDAHIISTQRGRGTYIWEEPEQEALQMIRREGLEAICRNCIEEALRMGFTEAETLAVFNEQVRSIRAAQKDSDQTTVLETKRQE